MKEDLLHFVWLYRKYPVRGLKTTAGETLHIENSGLHNKLSGPDFFNGKVRVEDQLWAGNIEIHIKSSHWYAHNHQQDPNYNNVILHVVWEDDVSVFRPDGTIIPTLELRNYISEELLENYRQLFDTKNYRFINCENEIASVDDFIKENWLDRLFIARLEQKSIVINQLLEFSNNDWEQVLFIMLLKNFGSKINKESFLELGKIIDFKIVRKLYGKSIELESLLMGQAGLLKQERMDDSFYNQLKKEYDYLKQKFQLKSELFKSPEFFKLRPSNFPTIRLSQLASIYAETNNLFQSLIEEEKPVLSSIFNRATSSYWETHYTFGKQSKKSKKMVSKKFIDLIVINTLVPLRFCYQRYQGKTDNEAIIATMLSLQEENNSILKKYKDLGMRINNAKTSQAYLQLHNEYCSKQKCLDCAIGAQLMNIKV